jgi:hypothetical protein
MGFFKSPAEKAVKILYKNYSQGLDTYFDPRHLSFKEESKWINDKKFYVLHSAVFRYALTFASREIFRQKNGSDKFLGNGA